jgi:hypothetical protein
LDKNYTTWCKYWIFFNIYYFTLFNIKRLIMSIKFLRSQHYNHNIFFQPEKHIKISFKFAIKQLKKIKIKGKKNNKKILINKLKNQL